ncbi:MAG: DUF2817 domain-containing protein, partial [Lachnospiraceae bacterium]|nr:DUF2817 domain-containing protein [Lachnospiraceae bacterium]
MKRKLLIISGAIVTILLLATFISPYLILMADKQEEVAQEYAYSEVFFDEYTEVRAHILETVDSLQADGYAAELHSYPVTVADTTDDDLYIDTIYIPSKSEETNLIVLTTGVHGIEGYIGSVMLDVFWKEIYPDVDVDNTGVLVVANVNPYGMKYHRRYNENNVDLNRNFILDWDTFDLTVNKDYPNVEEFLGPRKQMGNILWHEADFYTSMIGQIIQNGVDSISNALLGGQYEYAEGVYYG